MVHLTVVLCLCSVSIIVVRAMSINESTRTPADFPNDSKGYIIVAGGVSNNKFVANFFAYNISNDSWLALPDLPSPRGGGGLVAHQGNPYYASGSGKTGGINDVVMLFADETVWIEGPPLQNISTAGTTAVSLDGILYVLGGNTNYLEKFNCSSGRYVWDKAASTQQTHYYSGAAVLNGHIYVCGTTWGNPSTLCERYDPATDAWSTISPMSQPRTGMSIVVLNGYLYVIGGADAHNERYDPASGEWSYFSNVPNQQFFQAAATDGKKIYVVGGTETSIQDMNEYLPEFDIWLHKKPYPISIRSASAMFVDNLP